MTTARHHQSVLLTYLRPQLPRVSLLAACLFTGIGLQLLGPLILRRFIDTAAGGASVGLNQLWLLGGVFIASTLITQGVQVGVAWFSEQVGWRTTNQLRRDLAEHCIHLDMAFHTARTPGELIERIDGDVTALASFFSQFIIQILGGAALMLGILVVLFAQDWRVGAAMSTFAVAGVLLLSLTRNIAHAHYEKERQAWSELAGFLEERIGGLDDVRANGGGAYVMLRLDRLAANLVGRGVAAGRRGLWIFITTNLTITVGLSISMILGVWLFQQRTISIGTVYLFFQYAGMLGEPLFRIGGQLQQLQQATASLTRVGQLREITPQILDGPGAPWTPAAPAVAFDDVSFAYDARERVLEGVNFELAAGQTLGLLGRTGSGKTTLSRLLFRLYDPTVGAIRLDGVDIRQGALAQLRSRIGLVTQDVQLFGASVRDNATLFDKAIPDARVLEVLEDLGLGPWLSRLSGGLDAWLDGNGGLSAGEAQLLAFARVFLKDPGLVVLDEASSRLDPATDRLIEHAMDKLLAANHAGGVRRTAVIIAHKLATVRRADQILILERGRIVEAGARKQLAADPASRFSQLLRSGIEEVLA